jgi:hypothetical protein
MLGAISGSTSLNVNAASLASITIGDGDTTIAKKTIRAPFTGVVKDLDNQTLQALAVAYIERAIELPDIVPRLELPMEWLQALNSTKITKRMAAAFGWLPIQWPPESFTNQQTPADPFVSFHVERWSPKGTVLPDRTIILMASERLGDRVLGSEFGLRIVMHAHERRTIKRNTEFDIRITGMSASLPFGDHRTMGVFSEDWSERKDIVAFIDNLLRFPDSGISKVLSLGDLKTRRVRLARVDGKNWKCERRGTGRFKGPVGDATRRYVRDYPYSFVTTETVSADGEYLEGPVSIRKAELFADAKAEGFDEMDYARITSRHFGTRAHEYYVTPKDVAVGIPADLLRRRPDVRAAERRLAAQCAEIGIADSEFYPHISIDGTLGWRAQDLNHLFESRALNGNIGPSFTWNLLNYGRLLNDVRLQDARFQELIATYQNTVLLANQDVENGLITFLKSQERTALQQYAVDMAVRAVDLAVKQYRAGTTDFTTVTQVQQIQVQQQDLLAQAQGEIAAGLIQVYRALGGGWQIRLQGCNASLPPPGAAANLPQSMPSPEAVPTPLPNSPNELPKPQLPRPENPVPTVPQPLPPSASSALPTAPAIPLISLTSAVSPTASSILAPSMGANPAPAAPAMLLQLPSVVAPAAPTSGGPIGASQIAPVVAPSR